MTGENEVTMNILPNPYGIKIYNVSIGKSIPQWIQQKNKNSLKYNEGK